MSRIGKQPITIPEKTEVSVSDDILSVKGPLDVLTRKLHPLISIKVENNEVVVTPTNKSPQTRALWGTYASHVKNMIQGVHKAYEKKLTVEGIGYKVNLSGKNLELIVGYSYPVVLIVPEGINVVVEKNNISISGSDKEKVGQFAAEIRAVKKPEPYKGKGVRYKDEIVRRKQGKKIIG